MYPNDFLPQILLDAVQQEHNRLQEAIRIENLARRYKRRAVRANLKNAIRTILLAIRRPGRSPVRTELDCETVPTPC